MIDIKQVQDAINESHIPVAVIARETGLSYVTVFDIKSGKKKNHKIETLQKILTFLKR